MAIPLASYPTIIWDGDSLNPDREARQWETEPNNQDWDRAVSEVIAMQTQTQNYSDGLWAPSAEQMRKPAIEVIENFQAGHGYGSFGTGNVTDDTVDFLKGSQSLKGVTGNSDSVWITKKTGISPTINLTDKSLVIWIKTSSISRDGFIQVYVSSNNLAGDNHFWFIEGQLINQGGEWSQISLSFASGVSAGSLDRSAINAIQVRANDKGEGPWTIHLGGIGAYTHSTDKLVSVSFDDGAASVYTTARPLMDAYNMPGTVFAVPTWVGSSAFYATLTQLQQLQDQFNWAICGHDATNYVSLGSEAAVFQAAADVKKWMIANGFAAGADHFALPQGAYDVANVVPALSKIFTSVRTAESSSEALVEPLPVVASHRLRCLNTLNTTSVSDITDAIDAVEAEGGWLHLLFHSITTTADSSTKYATADFSTVIDYIAGASVEVVTASDVFRRNNW